MFLIKPLLVFLSTLAFTAAYSAPGAYERLMVYYAYIMDVQSNNGVAKTIAPTCAQKFGGGKPCNLNQLIRSIAKVDPGEVTVTTKAFGEIVPFEDTVNEIQRQNLAGVIDVGLANSSVGRGATYKDFLAKTSGYLVQLLHGNSPQEIKDAARTSMNHVLISRMSASIVAFTERNPDFTIKTKTSQIPGTEDILTQIDFKASAASSGVTAKTLFGHWNDEIAGGHGANIQALTESISQARYC
ncbi:hypothetical protein Trco_004650 [Trichoderma cornu-damae]|uniref:Uncharacterized protein n=1 Tax=Trichoderma cornu-damae TaxID=654480 RepID=A0A9P8TUZ3_9HYPO|nr:hypothetical protein Trco_004650 [Trichoderma cornu-damae]